MRMTAREFSQTYCVSMPTVLKYIKIVYPKIRKQGGKYLLTTQQATSLLTKIREK